MQMDLRALYVHHFAAIAGADLLAGPVLATQMGFKPVLAWWRSTRLRTVRGSLIGCALPEE